MEQAKTELKDAIELETEAQRSYAIAAADVKTEDQESLKLAIDLIDTRGQLLRAQQDYNEASIEYNRILDLQTNNSSLEVLTP